MMKFRRITILLVISILLVLSMFSVVSTKAQEEVPYEISGDTVRVTIGNVDISITARTAISSISIGGVQVVSAVGFGVFAPGWRWIGGTWYYGEVLEPPTVEEIPGGIRVRTHAKFPPESEQYFEFIGIYTIYSTGMIMANYTITAYENVDTQGVLFYVQWPISTFKGSSLYIAYGGTISSVNLPEEFKSQTLSSGSYSVAYASTKYGDLVVILLSPPSIGYDLDDARAWGGDVFELKGTIISGTLTKGTTYKMSLVIYPHSKGSEFTNMIVSAFSGLGAAKTTLETLKKSKPRTPGGAKLLSQCEREVELAYKAFSQGDIEGTYTHAKKALELAQAIKYTERRQRIIFFVIIPNIIGLILMLLVVKTILSKVKSES